MGSPGEAETEPPAIQGNWVLNTLGALGLVIALILLLRVGLNRMGGRSVSAGRQSVVEVLARVSVAPRSHVMLLRLGGRVLLVGDGSGGMRTLAQVDEPEEVADLLAAITAARPDGITQSFRQLFDRFGGDYADDGAATLNEGADGDEFHVDRARDQLSGLVAKVRSLAGRK